MKVLEPAEEVRRKKLSEKFKSLRCSVKSTFEKFLIKINAFLKGEYNKTEENEKVAVYIRSNFKSLKDLKFDDIFTPFDDYDCSNGLKLKLLKFWLRSGEKIQVIYCVYFIDNFTIVKFKYRLLIYALG